MTEFVRCKWCKGLLTKCRMDSRGLCIFDPRSTGVEKKRTRREKKSDRRMASEA